GKDEMAAVAVLLAASSMTTPVAEQGAPSLPVPTEEDATVMSFIQDGPESPPLSAVDRFISNFEMASDNLSSEVGSRTGQVDDFGPEWVWHRRPTEASGIPVPF